MKGITEWVQSNTKQWDTFKEPVRPYVPQGLMFIFIFFWSIKNSSGVLLPLRILGDLMHYTEHNPIFFNAEELLKYLVVPQGHHNKRKMHVHM